jgi:glycosyltransferase involved in cell wall biosynthesis
MPMLNTAVVIPLFNGAPWIHTTLLSVMRQSLPAAEVVVVDDGSDDGSPEIARRIPGVTVVRHPGKGIQYARRHGAGLTTAPLLAFLDQDDLWHPDHLADLTGLLESSKAAAAVGHCQRFAHERSLRLEPARGPGHEFDPWTAFPAGVVATPSCVLIRRAALDAVGGWPASGRLGRDTYMWLRLSERAPLVASGGTTVGYRRHSLSASARSRATAPAQFLADAYEANASALDAFRRSGRTVDGVDRRWAAYAAMVAVATAVLSGDRRGLEAAVAKYHAQVADEPVYFVRSCHEMLFYFLAAREVSGPVSAERERILAVLEAWPADDVQSPRSVFSGVNALAWRRAVGEQLRREPWHLRRWLVWFRTARSAAAKSGWASKPLLNRLLP